MILSFVLITIALALFIHRKKIIDLLSKWTETPEARFERIWQENLDQLKTIRSELATNPMSARKQALLMAQELKFLSMQEAISKLSNMSLTRQYLEKLSQVEKML